MHDRCQGSNYAGHSHGDHDQGDLVEWLLLPVLFKAENEGVASNMSEQGQDHYQPAREELATVFLVRVGDEGQFEGETHLYGDNLEHFSDEAQTFWLL